MIDRDTIIRMARETGVEWLMHNQFYKDHLQHFAALIASQVAAAAKAEEREACAKAVEASPSYDWHKFACEAAAAIRARGETSSRGQA